MSLMCTPSQHLRGPEKLQWRGHVRKILYQVQFDSNLMLGIDRVLNRIIYADQQATPREYLQAMTLALASEQLLSELLPHFQYEAAVRQFLVALKRRLESDLELQ
ncbi:MAG TPA: hypothetical protein VGD69_20925 [Herpetosiphonaceae bacterium]